MKASFLDKLIGRLDRIDPASLQNHLQSLAQEKEFLETIFNTIREGVIVADSNGQIRYLNRAAGELLGIVPENAEGRSVADYLREMPATAIAPSESDPQKIVAREFEIFYPQHRFLNVYSLPIQTAPHRASAEKNRGFVCILSDVTETRRRAATTIESERLNALTMLAAAVAHELGNPLNSLTIHLQLLERELKKIPEAKRKKASEHLRVAQDEIARLNYLIAGFLRAMRPAKLNLEPTDVNEMVRQTLQVIQPELEDRGILVRQLLAQRLPPVPLDGTQIKQAFFNVIKNAMQSMTSGGTLTIQTEADETHVIVSFSDIGGGIAAKNIGNIFQPFQTTKSNGAGLGLMIVQRIVRAHGGALELETAEGAGTTVRIRLLIHPRRVKLLEAPKEETEKVKEVKKVRGAVPPK